MTHITRDDPMKILVAAGLGFAAGLLLAPRSGPETRERLREQAEEAKTRMRNATDELKRHGNEGKEQIREAAASVTRTGKTMKDNLTTTTKNAAKDVKKSASKTDDTQA